MDGDHQGSQVDPIIEAQKGLDVPRLPSPPPVTEDQSGGADSTIILADGQASKTANRSVRRDRTYILITKLFYLLTFSIRPWNEGHRHACLSTTWLGPYR